MTGEAPDVSEITASVEGGRHGGRGQADQRVDKAALAAYKVRGGVLGKPENLTPRPVGAAL